MTTSRRPTRLGGMFAALADLPEAGGGPPARQRVRRRRGLRLRVRHRGVARTTRSFGLTEVRLGILPGAHQSVRDPPARRSRRARADAHGRALRRRPRAASRRRPPRRARGRAGRQGGRARGASCSRARPQAQERIKTAARALGRCDWEEYRRSLPEHAGRACAAGDEARDGLAAFLEKRKPRWVE